MLNCDCYINTIWHSITYNGWYDIKPNQAKLLYRYLQHHSDKIIKTDAKRLLYKNIVPLTLLQGFEKVIQGLRVRGSWRPNINCNILTPTLMAVSVVSFLFSWCSTGGQTAQLSAGWWLSLLHLISIFSEPQLIRAPSPFGLVWLSLPLTSITPSPTVTGTGTPWLLSWLSYIRVQRPLDRPLDLWNRMFNRHQAEITVMQLRGHSLPVRQSMRVSWDFLACPILLANFRPRDFLS